MLEVPHIFADSPSIDTLPALQLIQNSAIFPQALALLADGARIEDRREAYGQLLGYLLELQHDCPHGRDEALRAIANACADNDSNRERVLKSPHFGAMLERLHSDSSRYIALAALYNITLDYEPAQEALREKDVFLELVKVLDPCSHDITMVHHLSGLLSFASEDWDVSRSPDMILKALLRFSSPVDGRFAIDDLLPISRLLMTHLKQERFQHLLFSADLFEAFLVLILRLFGYEMSSTSLPSTFPSNPPPEDEREDFEPLQTSAIVTLRDLSSLPAFFEKNPLESKTTKIWLSWLKSGNPDLQVISCCLLSNLAREKEQWAIQLFTVHGIHIKLGELCASEEGDRVPLAALELLLQLARPPQNRPLICNHPFLSQLSRTWSIDPDTRVGLVRIQYASVAVLLGLVRDCPQAIIPLVEHTGAVTPETAYSSHLQHLMICFERSSSPQVRTEIAKVVMAITKAMASTQDLNADVLWDGCIAVNPAFVTPIATVISQTDDLGLQAQGYFTLVIVARKGCITIVRDIIQQEPVLGHLLAAARNQPLETVQDSQAILQRSVHENARCLVKEMADRQMGVSCK